MRDINVIYLLNGSCTYAPHQDYTSMILKKDSASDDETSIPKTNEKSSDASSSIISTTCRSSEFSCRDGSCIPYYDVCNSYEDCPSGIDEAMCSPGIYSLLLLLLSIIYSTSTYSTRKS
jgi:hypothetical protein